jgi:hypothetical protein
VEGGVHILDLAQHHCRGIVGRGPDGLVRYCGAHVAMRPKRWRGTIMIGSDGLPMEKALSWCEEHASVYFNH